MLNIFEQSRKNHSPVCSFLSYEEFHMNLAWDPFFKSLVISCVNEVFEEISDHEIVALNIAVVDTYVAL